MSEITNDGLTRSGTGCLQLYPDGNIGSQRVIVYEKKLTWSTQRRDLPTIEKKLANQTGHAQGRFPRRLTRKPATWRTPKLQPLSCRNNDKRDNVALFRSPVCTSEMYQLGQRYFTVSSLNKKPSCRQDSRPYCLTAPVGVTSRYRSHLIAHMPFPIGGPLEPSLYL